jgi:Arc/MetJ family transcription regulator
MATRKTSIEIDEDLVEKVRQLLGTDTLKDTIEGALLSVVRDRARRAEVKALQDMEGMDLNDAKVMARAWRS